MTEEQRETIRLTEEQMMAQDKLNFAVGVWWDLSQSIGQAWSQSLMGVIDGTMSVSQAFEEMGRAILKTMADIAAQQATMALFQLGAGAAHRWPDRGYGRWGRRRIGGGGRDQSHHVSARRGRQCADDGHARGESVHNPEVVLNRQQMQSMFGGSGSSQQSQVIVNNFPDRKSAEEDAARQRGQGHQVIVNAVLENLSIGESSSINRAMRALQR